MIRNLFIVLFLATMPGLPGVLCKPGDAVNIKVIPEPLGEGWYRHWFTYGDMEVEDEQVGVGTGYVYYLTETSRHFNFSYPGPNRMRNIITYVEGEFITDTDFVEVALQFVWQRLHSVLQLKPFEIFPGPEDRRQLVGALHSVPSVCQELSLL